MQYYIRKAVVVVMCVGSMLAGAVANADMDDARALAAAKITLIQAIEAAEDAEGCKAFDASIDDDSFKIIQHFTVLAEKTVNNNEKMSMLYTETVDKTTEIIISTGYKLGETAQSLLKNKFEVNLTFEKEIPENIYVEKLVAYSKDGKIVWEDSKAVLVVKGTNCTITTSKQTKPLPKTAYILHWELASTTDGMCNIGGQLKFR